MRLAIYIAPRAGTPLADVACGWLGRDAQSDEPVTPRPVPGLAPARQAVITASPRHYGFHATLKAPFALAGGVDADDLDAAVAELAAGWQPFEVRLAIASLGGFLALMPGRPCPPIEALAGACVRELDRFRAPPSAEELARRRTAGLTPRQEELLRAFGYPYVLDEFRVHMTLTGRLAEAERRRVQAALEPVLGPLLEAPVAIDALSIFAQEASSAPFVEIRRQPLARGR